MSMNHIHIYDDKGPLGLIWVDQHGKVSHDNSPAAIGAIHHTNHGHTVEHGQALLDAIVKHYDRSTYVAARHCQKPECVA